MPAGFALRYNGSCKAGLQECGVTGSKLHVCCPTGTYCTAQYNINCCPTTDNCTESILQSPQCANNLWDLYDNGGYFCCESGTIGYNHQTPQDWSDGCASPGYPFQSGDTLLPMITAASSTLASALSSVTGSFVSASISSTSSASAQASPSNNAGIIAGGVIGGVGLLLLFGGVVLGCLRRRKKKKAKEVEMERRAGSTGQEQEFRKPELATEHGPAQLDGDARNKKPGQLDDQHGISEMGS